MLTHHASKKLNRHSGLTKLHESYSWSFGIISAAKIILDDIPADEKGNEAQDDEINCLQIREIFQHSASPSQGRRFGILKRRMRAVLIHILDCFGVKTSKRPTQTLIIRLPCLISGALPQTRIAQCAVFSSICSIFLFAEAGFISVP
jgi:hypothetical protein